MSAGIYSYKTLFWGLAAALLAACGGGGGGNGGGSGPPPANLAPTASFTATPSSGTAPLTVAFNASASSDSDGSTGGGSMVSHTYTGAGSFTARLTVTDNGGLAASTTRVITVNAAPPPTGGAFNNTANVKSPLGTNLMRPADFSNEFPFVDHMKQAREWFSGKPLLRAVRT